jgi:hypothetical protein
MPGTTTVPGGTGGNMDISAYLQNTHTAWILTGALLIIMIIIAVVIGNLMADKELNIVFKICIYFVLAAVMGSGFAAIHCKLQSKANQQLVQAVKDTYQIVIDEQTANDILDAGQSTSDNCLVTNNSGEMLNVFYRIEDNKLQFYIEEDGNLVLYSEKK